MAKLILIDGPPGSGKSTLGSSLAASLPSYRLVLEMDPSHPLHPIQVGNQGADFGGLRDMDVEQLGDLLLAKWSDFLNQMLAEDVCYILESYPYQSHARVLWQMNASPEFIKNWLYRLHSLLESHCPVLVMLRFKASIMQNKQVFEARGSEWSDFIVDFICGTTLAKSRQLKGLEGTLTFLEFYGEQLQAWSRLWPFGKVNLDAWIDQPSELANQVRKLALGE